MVAKRERSSGLKFGCKTGGNRQFPASRRRPKAGDWSRMIGDVELVRHNSKFIDNIVEEISAQVLSRTYLNVAKYPVGIESRVQDMNELLGVGVNDVRMVGIWGIHGIGKTTIAKAVYNSISHEFEGSCFLENVRENSMEPGGLVQLQKIVLSEILGEEQLELTDVDEGINVIKKRLSRKRVLLILDGVNQMEQLKKLVGGSDWFGLGSRIIITSSDKHLLTGHQVNLIYEVEELDFDEAFELFSWNAFPINKLPDDYAKVAAAIVHYAKGIPLALTIIGSLLCGRSIDQWRITLDDYRRVPNLEIQYILKISYDALEDSVKEVFIDIACFLNGKNKKYVIKMLESCHLNPEYGIEVLIEKAFIIIKKDHIWMNDLIEELGKEIVLRQDSLTGRDRRSKLWFYKNVNHVLSENKGISETKGIVVKSHVADEKHLSSKSFLKATSAKWIFLLIALCLEILSLAFDQASSPSNPHYALFGMMLAIVAVLICILELIYKGKKERVELRRWRTLWWFYYPRPQRRLYGSLPDIYGLVGAISQCICSTVQYVCFIRHDQNPIKVSLWPAIFLICLGVSRLNWIRMDETDGQNE
ncbi:TMV resistance protein N-like [Prunus dulcis]|uniref:TMV resistance protein N-like n=1 Tax=Prunus dulcis TaxID=3755 RepID=UPI00148328EC|nr:TMV resistance protein N-like [Prunus dulcis]